MWDAFYKIRTVLLLREHQPFKNSYEVRDVLFWTDLYVAFIEKIARCDGKENAKMSTKDLSRYTV